MVYVKDELFPRSVIVVVREALMALGDEAIGAHLQKNGGGAGKGGAASWGSLSFILVLALGLWIQVPWEYMLTPTPVRGLAASPCHRDEGP